MTPIMTPSLEPPCRLKRRLLPLAIASAFGSTLGLSPPVLRAQDSGPQAQLFDLDLPAQPLSSALAALSRQTGKQVFADGALVAGRSAPALRGRMSLPEALNRLLAGSDLTSSAVGSGFVIKPPVELETVELEPIVVTARALDQGFKADTQESATKTPLSIRETPQAISVITRESMDARQTRDLNAALELVAGAGADSFGGGPFAGPSVFITDAVTLRGQSLEGGAISASMGSRSAPGM
ncbi:MAG: secretin and TonB N-terminal domain-containing protein [Burkholderiales bacterium]